MLVGDTPTPRAEGHSALTCAGETFLPGVPVPSSRPFLVPQSRRAQRTTEQHPALRTALKGSPLTEGCGQ